MAAIKLLEYTFDNTIQVNCLPKFIGLDSSGYTISDTVADTVTTRIITVNDGVNLPTRVWFCDDGYKQGQAILTLNYFNTNNINDMQLLFYQCNHLTSVNTTGWDTSKVTNMYAMFYQCSKLETVNVSNFNLANCTSIARMFSGSGITTLDLSKWNMSNVQNISRMFENCYNLTTLNLSNWNTSGVTSMSAVFANTPNLTSYDVAHFNTSRVENMESLFSGNGKTELDLSDWDVSKVSNMRLMFYQNKATSINMVNWKTSRLQDMYAMFCDSRVTTLDVAHFDTSNVTNMNQTFDRCYATSINVIGWDTSRVNNMSAMFRGCRTIELDLSSFNTTTTANMGEMFKDCTSLQSLDLSNFDTTNVNRMNGMFYNCSSLQTLDISSFNTKKASPALYHMFYNCSSLRVLDFSNFDSSSGLDFNSAFNGCRFEQIGLLYSSATSINDFANRLRPNYNCEIYYLDADPSELNPVNNITYVQYQENILYLPPSLTLRSNGDIHDEYNPFTSQFTQRIGEDGSVLENPVIATVKSIVAYNDTVKYGYALPDKTTDLYHPEVESYEQVIDSTTLNGTENWTKVNQTTFTTPFINAKSETSTEVFTMKGDVESITIVNDTLSLVFKETSYVATNNIAVNALKIWLQTNNVEFKYELKERIFTDMTLEEFDFDNAHFVKPQAYKGGVMTQSNKDDLIFAPITYQTKSNNRYELPLLDSNSEYTLHYEGSVNEVDLGGSTNSSVESNGLVQSGSSDKVVLFDDEVSNVMLIKGDVREQTIPYFQGLLSTQAPVLKAIKVDTDQLSTVPFSFFEKPAQDKIGWCSFVFDEGFNGRIRVKLKPDAPSGFRFVCFASKETTYTNAVLKEGIDIEVNNASYIGFHDPNNGIATTNKGNLLQLIKDGDVQITLQEKGKPAIYAYTSIDDVKTSILSTPKDIELRSIGNLCDTLDCKTGELVQHIGKTTLNGSENWEKNYVSSDEKYLVAQIPNFFDANVTLKETQLSCDKMKVSYGHEWAKEEKVMVNGGTLIVFISTEKASDINKFKAWLSENPLTVQYELTNPVITTVDLDIKYKEGDKKYIVRTHDDVTHVNVSSEGLAPITEIGYITNEDNVETVTLEDGMVTLENAKPHSVIQRAFMTGQTLVNLVSQYENSNGVLKATINGTFETNKKYIIRIYNNPFNVKSRQIVVKDATYQYTYFAENRVFINDMNRNYNQVYVELTKSDDTVPTVDEIAQIKVLVLEYQEGMENWDIPYFEGIQSVKLPVLTTSGVNVFFEDNTMEYGAWASNGIAVSTTSEIRCKNKHTPFPKGLKNGDKMYIVLSDTSINSDTNMHVYDENKSYLSLGNRGCTVSDFVNGVAVVSINDIAKCSYFSFRAKSSNINCEFALMINDCVPYEPFKTNILSCNEDIELKSFEDLRDELNLLTGEMTQRVEKIVLDGSEDGWTYDGKGSTTAICYIENYFTTPPTTAITNYFSLIETRTGVFWNAGQDHEMFCVNDTSLAFRIEKTKLKTLDSNGIKEWLSQNPLTIQYPLATEIAKTIDLTLTQQNVPSEKMTYFKDYYGQLVSDGTLPKFTYRLESTNTYNVSQLKPNTLYTMYSEGEATVATLGGKASILLNNPQTLTSGIQNKSLTFDSPTSKVVLIEKDVTNQVVPYFTGTLDTVNPIIKTKSGNKSNTVSTNVHLRSVGDVCDTYDLNTGTLVKRVSEDHKVLDRPETSILPVNAPVAYHGATVEMSSNELSLLPRFEYSCKSPNYYPLPVESNEVYTLKFDKTSNGTLTMGGVTANTTGNQTITTKNSDVQGVLFSGDLGIGNLMVMKTDVRNVPTPYFRGIRSVVNPTITVSDGGTQSNSVALTLTMRSLPNGVKDELNLVTGEYIQRLDQRNFAEGDVNSRDMITDGTTTIYPLTVPRRSTLELNWSDGVLTAYDGTTNVTTEAELLKPHLFFQLATSTLEEIISQLKDENASLLETVATLEEDNLSTMVAVTEVFEAVLVMMPMTLDVNSNTKGGGSYMVEVYVTLILKGKKTLEQVPAVIRPQVEQMLKDVDAL